MVLTPSWCACVVNMIGCYLRCKYGVVGYQWLLSSYCVCAVYMHHPCFHCVHMHRMFNPCFSDPESVTICSCNVKHADCINNTCKTGWKCLRQIEMYSHNNTIKRNDQFCDYSPHAPGDAAGCAVTSPHRDDNGIVSFLLCCRGTDYCNANNATLEEYLRDNGLSGACIMMC